MMVTAKPLARKQEVTVQEILDALAEYHPKADFNLVKRAFVFAEQAHRPQRRKNGDPYIGHPVAVARILTSMRMDVASICAALLHDTVEDTNATLEDLQEIFSPEIADLVDGVTKLSKIRFRSKEERQAENFRKMLIAMSKDIRVILVKLADRTHNMRTLQHLPPEKRIGIARETMDIFAPIANRLGLGATKIELEDLSFRHLYPDEYEDLRKSVNKRIEERREYTNRVTSEIEGILKDSKIQGNVSGRPKHFWSIHRKMVTQKIPFEKIYDGFAFRVLVDKSSECYHALGVIHERWKPVPGRFKDYIALPKPNNYQSLHTTMVGPEGYQIEVQIRTAEMHTIAERGIAAHWKYKEGARVTTSKEEARFEWLKRMMEWQKELEDPDEFLESVKVELFADEVYTFTPRGELKVLPRGATPVDFAFSIHSEVGNTCSGAIVNGSIVPLNHKLRNGDTLEIITNRSQQPNKDWLKFVATNRAKSRIKAFIKAEQRERSYELGEQILDKYFRRYSKAFSRLRKSKEFQDLATHFNLVGTEELIVQVGSGKITPATVVAAVLPEGVVEKSPKPRASTANNAFVKFIKKVSGAPTGVVVDGLEGVKHSIAKCCSPVPGEAITGVVTQAHVVSVHRHSCVNVLAHDSQRLVDVSWGSGESGYPVFLRIITETGLPGLLSKMTKVFSDLGINIDMANCAEDGNGRASNVFRFHAKHVSELKGVIHRMETIRGVYTVERVRDQSDV
jgi:guanosine-3',5'-bis(diphosphate) 3'-pyrophosphohydrolase